MIVWPNIKNASYFGAAPSQPPIHDCVTANCCCLSTKSSSAHKAQNSTADYRTGLVQKCAVLPEVGATRYSIKFIPQMIRTSLFVTGLATPLQTDLCLVVLVRNLITVFTPTQTNRAKEKNKPEFHSTELNKTGVKTPWELFHTKSGVAALTVGLHSHVGLWAHLPKQINVFVDPHGRAFMTCSASWLIRWLVSVTSGFVSLKTNSALTLHCSQMNGTTFISATTPSLVQLEQTVSATKH